MTSSKPNWYAVYTLPKMERKIHSELVNQKVTSYLPMQKVCRKWSDRIKELRIPLFPNYLFVQIQEKERGDVLKVSGVTRFIKFDGRPVVISDNEIETIRKLECSDIEIEAGFVSGDRVQVVQGPFVGLEGILFRKKGKERFGVVLNGLRQYLSLEICVNLLRKL
jgi:transcription elongation factor/antiterminator RfaH